MNTLNDILSTPKVAEEICRAREQGRFRYLEYGKVKAGFFIWQEKVKDGILHILIGSLFICPSYRGKINMMKVITFLRKKYPGAVLCWTRDKYNKRLTTRRV